ncbi:MAG: signal peptidase I [Gorillibacterium sp.]|nr:signal peptidase I [Gorillibacterium sp.]
MRIKNLINIAMLALFLIMLFLAVISMASKGEPTLFGYQLKVVLSGSMEPGIKTGSIIAVKTGRDMNRLAEGDVITFQEMVNEEKRLITHRILNVTKQPTGQVLYQTKGDNNDNPDSKLVLSQNVVAVYTGFTLPYVGFLLNFFKSKIGNVLILIIPGIFLIGYSLITIWRTLSGLEISTKKDPIENQK